MASDSSATACVDTSVRLRFRILGGEVWGFKIRIYNSGLGFGVTGLRVYGAAFQSLGCRVSSDGCRVYDLQ